MTSSEAALLKRAQHNDLAAFELLQECHEPAVRRFIRRLIGYSSAEDDIVQSVFFALYRHIDNITPPEGLKPYLFRMVRNRCYDELRSMGRWDDRSLDDEAVEVSVSFQAAREAPSPEEAAHWLLLQLEVREAIDRLPELQRQTLILYAEEGLTYAEIATAMNTSIGTVKSRLHHAKTTLRRLVRPETIAAIQDAD